MANIVELIGRMRGNFVPELGVTTEQVVFSVVIPAGTLGVRNSLRLTMQWGGCIDCKEVADNPENVFTEDFSVSFGRLIAVSENTPGVLGVFELDGGYLVAKSGEA